MRKTVVREVLDHFASASAVLSLYSDTDRGRRSAKEIVIALKNLNRDALRLVEDWSREDQEAMRDLLEKVFPRVEDLSKDLPRGWSFFVSPQSPPFALPLPASVAAEASFGPRPRLFPLIQALSPFRETLVVVVENKAILFFRRYGAELTLMTRRDVEFPPKIKSGGRYGMDERRIERHGEEETARLLREAAAEAKRLYGEGTFRRLLVFGARELTQPLLERLHEMLPTEEIDLLPESPEKGEGALQALLDQWAYSRFWQEGEGLVMRILSEAPKGGPAAAGLRAVLAASNRGGVHQLVVEEYERRRGVLCPSCGSLGIDEATCPLCGHETDEEPDLLEALVQQVFEKDGEALVLGRPSPLREWEGIGALLRFVP